MDSNSKITEEPVVPAPTSAPTSAPVKKSGKGAAIYGMIILAILAIGGIGFGVWAMMDGNTQKANYEKQISDLRAQNNQLLEQNAGGGDVDIDADVDDGTSSVDPADYIYIGEWGIKIKKPENLAYVDYRYENSISDGNEQYPEWGDQSSIMFYGITSNAEKTFAKEYLRQSIIKNCGMISLRRVLRGDYLPVSTVTVVRQDDNYDYIVSFNQESFFSCARKDVDDIDVNAAVVIVESEGANLINEMLSNPNNYSNI